MGAHFVRRQARPAGMGQSWLPTSEPIRIPAFSIDPLWLLVGGGVLFIGLFLQRGEPERERKRAAKKATEARKAAARAILAEP